MIKFLAIPFYLLPHSALVWSGNRLGDLFFFVIRFRRKTVFDNLYKAFGKELSDKQLHRLARKNYQHYGKTLLELLQSIWWTKEDFKKNTVLEGREIVEKLLQNKRGGIVLGSHVGNWEFSIAVVAAHGFPIDFIVKDPKTKLGKALLDWYRSRFGSRVYVESGNTKEIYQAINSGRIVTFVLDQFMGPPIGLPVTFFNAEAGTAAGLALMTERRSCPIIVGYSYRDEKGIIHVVLEPQIEFNDLSENRVERLYAKTQIYNNAIEHCVRRHPEQWLWLHRRWKAFKGQPRWQLTTVSISLIFAFFVGCTSEVVSPTGIDLPSDPQVAVPEFRVEAEGVAKQSDKNASGGLVPEESPISEPQPTKPKQAKGVKGIQTPMPSPSPLTPASKPVIAKKNFKVFSSDKIPYEVGEELKIDLKWLALPAGSAVLKVLAGPTFNGRKTYQFWANALSSRLVDAIYHVDNTAESFIDAEGLIPYKFLLHMFETHQKKETRVIFDHTQGKAHYWSKRLSKKWGDQDVDRQDVLVPGAMDMFSGIYFARTLNYELNQLQKFTLYENGQNWDVELVPVANELVVSGVGAFQCWKIQVKVTLNNVLKPTGDVFMWLSDDSKKYLVRFEAKIKIGSLYGILTSIKEH